MNKTAIKNFAIWARQKLISDITYKAGLLGVSIKGIAEPLPQSTKDLQLFDIGTKDYARVAGEQIKQRNALVEAIQSKLNDLDYASAFENVVEEVAYTWFNRLIAVRFMEVNDYLPGRVRLLSSENQFKHEPDLVTNPFDSDLTFSVFEQDLVISLKDENKLDELFRFLFVKQCNKLYDILPELFEPTNDYTELLLTLSFTDKDDVVYRLTHDIDERDFNISEIDDNGKPTGQVEIIGWLYQYYNTEPKAKVSADLKKNIKVSKENIPAATQLFTPDWIVRYMVENSLGRLWMDGHPADCKMKENWKYYLEDAEQEPQVQEQLAEIKREHGKLNLEEIKFIDPCMGSGHILVYAFDVFMQIYEAQGFTQRDAAQRIVEHNLYGLEIDKRAYQLAYFAVMMKARQYDRRFFSRGIAPQLYCPTGYHDGAEFGSLLVVDKLEDKPQEDTERHLFTEKYADELNRWNFRHLLAQKYDVVCTNPPYMAVSNAGARLNEYVKKNFADGKADLFAAFIERCGQLLKYNGYQAMITQHAWMFLSSFEKLRGKIQLVDIVNMAHLGARAFEEIGGEVVQTTSFVIRKSHIKDFKGVYCRLIEPTTQQGKEDMFLAEENRYNAVQNNFSKIPGSPVAYWASKQVIENFHISKSLIDYSKPKVGQNTGDNERFLRFWQEVCINRIGFGVKHEDLSITNFKWIPYNKGGSFRRWYGNFNRVVNWENNGKEIKNYAVIRNNGRHWSRYIQNIETLCMEGISWSDIASTRFGCRYLPQGFICDVKGSSMYPAEELRNYILAFLNSCVSIYYLQILNPTTTFQVGNIGSLPFIFEQVNRINFVTDINIRLSEIDWDSYETSWDFKKHPLV